MLATVILSVLLAVLVQADGLGVKHVRERYEQLSRRHHYTKKWDSRHTTRQAAGPKFLNDKTSKFAVNGTAVPEVDFDVGESYAGSLPISSDPEEESSLFFWFFPSKNPDVPEEIIIWLNGGPGCSSFEGLLQENGPFLWQYGTYKPVPNPWSWHTLTNVIWVEQPVGTGFSTGNVTATSEEDIATQFNGFWKNFVDTFNIQGYKIFITGESYAGLYCPYIASAMLDANDTAYFDMAGVMIYDPSITHDIIQQHTPVVQFINYWSGLFPFNDTFRALIKAKDQDCGFSAYVEKYLVFPPKGPLPPELPGHTPNGIPAPFCMALYYDILEAAFAINPCFNIYQVTTTCPLLWDVLGYPGSQPYTPQGAAIYFDRTDVKTALHAPQSVSWATCNSPVLVNSTDTSPPPSFNVLPRVIDATANVIIAHGALDIILIANGTLLAIQNMTWGGKMGFQTRPDQPFYIPQSSLSSDSLATAAASGVFGSFVSERGLTYVSVALAGHMIPQYAPSAAYRMVEVFLGRAAGLNSTMPFTTDADPPPPNSETLGEGTAPQGWSDGY